MDEIAELAPDSGTEADDVAEEEETTPDENEPTPPESLNGRGVWGMACDPTYDL